MKAPTAVAAVLIAVIAALTGIDITLIATGHVEEAMQLLGGVALAAAVIGWLLWMAGTW